MMHILVVRDSAKVWYTHEKLQNRWYTQAMPSTQASGRAGILLPSRAALPRWRSTPSLPHKWEIASPSSCPVCLAKADPSFLTSLLASLCQTPKVSAASLVWHNYKVRVVALKLIFEKTPMHRVVFLKLIFEPTVCRFKHFHIDDNISS